MADAPVFVEDGSLALYWLTGAAAIAYLPSPGAGFSGQITLDQAWADRFGTYLFLDGRPPDTEAALAEIQAYLARLGTPGALRMVWLATGGAGSATWRSSALQFALPVPAPATPWLGQPAPIAFGRYSLWIGERAAIAPAGEEAGWGFTLTPASNSAFLWQGGADELAVTGPVSIPLSGPAAGCFVAQLPVPDFTGFGAAVSFFYEATEPTDLPPVDGVVPRRRTGYADRLALPLFEAGAGATLAATLDPTRPLDGARTCFALPAGGGPWLSRYASPRGHEVELSAAAAGASAARFIFQTAPIDVAPDSASFELHIVPEGTFDMTVSAPEAVRSADEAAAGTAPPWTPAERLLCGMSGIEYAGLPAVEGCRLVFSGGFPAFAPGAAQGVPPPDDTITLTAFAKQVATTAWAAVLPPAGQGGVTNYFSQAEQAPLYGATQAAVSTSDGLAAPPAGAEPGFLYFTELPSAQIGAGDAGTRFPIAPYRDLDPTRVNDARRLEAAGIAPARRDSITPPPHLAALAAAATPTRSVTPQGLVVDWDYDNPSVWTDVVLGNDVAPVSGTSNLLKLTSVRGALRAALQTNRLFLAAGCPGVFATGGSVRYCPGPDQFAQLIAAAPQDTVFPAVRNWYAANGWPVSQDEEAFKTTLDAIPGVTVDEAHFEALRRVAGLLRAEISGWKFQFSPWTWTSGTDATCTTGTSGTLMLMKFAPGKLADLVADPSTWAWPAVSTFGGSTADVRDKLVGMIADARARRRAAPPGTTPYDHFLDQVVDNPWWSGVLVLGCPIPLNELPGPLQCLAAGIDPKRFVAHHVGLNATAFQVVAGGIQLSQTSMFGLIDYEDEKELHLDPSPDAGFAYQVQRLTVEFVNSAIRSFSSRVALLPPRLFGSTITLRDTVRGNSILMDGVFQKPPNATSDAEGTYVFRIVEENLYDASDTVLTTIAIDSAEFSTVAPADSGDPNAVVHAQFRLGGSLTFEQIAAFDILSYGPGAGGADPASKLDFRNLLINLSFPLYKPGPPVFAEDDTKLGVAAASNARTQSLVNRFPVRLSALTGVPVAGGQAPADLGYVPADTPIANSRIEAPWWGIVYEVDLGTTGALSSGSALTVNVIAAWSGKGARDETPPLYIGVRMPGLKELVGASLPFESFLRLGFRNIKFTAYDTAEGNRAYLMRFRRFSVSALGVSFPPGNVDVVLFGNPNGDKNKVGWYAAYAADEDDQKAKLASADRLRLAARRGEFGRG